jgi:phage gp45-like
MPGTDAVAVFASGDRSNGVIIATGNQKYRLRNLKPGEVALYDNAGNIVKLAAGGNLEITCPTKVRVVTPRLEVTGDIIDHCDEQDHTDADMRTIYNSHTHRGVQPGSGNSGIPNQPQVAEDEP